MAAKRRSIDFFRILLAIRSADPGWRNSLALVAVVGHPVNDQNRSCWKIRQHRNSALGGFLRTAVSNMEH